MHEVYPTDPKRIKERIRRYERTFQQEQRRGVIDDGYGKRFLLGPLYMLLGDVPGALASFDWYERTFPDGLRASLAPSRQATSPPSLTPDGDARRGRT